VASLREKAKDLFERLKTARRVLVTSEPYPDGDALGAEIALGEIARYAFKLAPGGPAGQQVYLVNEKGCPRKYRFLAGADRIRRLDTLLEKDFDLGIVVDGGSERAGAAKEIFDRCPFRVLVDHHKMGSRERYDLALNDPESSSTTQILWTFFGDPGIGVPLTREAAEAIYLGIIFDTGSFQYSLTKPESHEIASRLLAAGIDFSRIAERALLVQEYGEIKVLGTVLASVRRTSNGEIVWGWLTHETMRQLDVSGDDLSKIIQILCFVEGTKVALLFREIEDGRFKVSLRSRGEVDVARVARELDPQGGGHDRAAGCTLEGDLEGVVHRTVKHIEGKLAETRR